MTIDMPVFRSLDGFSNETVRVELVDIAPHITNATWAVGRNSDSRLGWRVYNVETGQACGKVNDAPTRAACVRKARAFLAAKTNRMVADRYRAWLRHCNAIGAKP